MKFKNVIYNYAEIFHPESSNTQSKDAYRIISSKAVLSLNINSNNSVIRNTRAIFSQSTVIPYEKVSIYFGPSISPKLVLST
jgi:hypothetical protein